MTRKDQATIYLDTPYLKLLKKISDKNGRTLVGQVRFWIDMENKK